LVKCVWRGWKKRRQLQKKGGERGGGAGKFTAAWGSFGSGKEGEEVSFQRVEEFGELIRSEG